VVEESYIKSQARLVRFATNCSNRGYVLMSTYVIFAQKLFWGLDLFVFVPHSVLRMRTVC